MRVKDIVAEDFVNYKDPSMYIISVECDFKCCKEIGQDLCQNMDIVHQPTKDIDDDTIIKSYLGNPITKAIVIAGLEPMLQFDELKQFIHKLRWEYNCFDPVVIYTGYYPDEIADELSCLQKFDNIIVKFGRFRPNCPSHFDEVLGVNLVNPEQWAEKIS